LILNSVLATCVVNTFNSRVSAGPLSAVYLGDMATEFALFKHLKFISVEHPAGVLI